MHTTKRIISVFIVSLFILGLIPTYVQNVKALSANIWVSNSMGAGWYDESHVHTLTEAITNLSSGGLIRVWAGIYDNFTITKSCTITGNGTSNTKISSSMGGDYPITVEANLVVIRDLTLMNASVWAMYQSDTYHDLHLDNINVVNTDGGVYIYGDDNLVEYCTFSDNVDGVLTSGDDMTIEYCDFHNLSDVAILNDGGDDLTVNFCTFSENAPSELTWGTLFTRGDSALIYECDFSDERSGVVSDEASNCIIQGCEFTDCWLGVNFYTGCSDTYIYECTFYGGSPQVDNMGVYSAISTGTTVEDCVFMDYGYGVTLKSEHGIEITPKRGNHEVFSSTFEANTIAIAIDGEENVTIHENTIEYNDYALTIIGRDDGFGDVYYANNITIYNNIFENNSYFGGEELQLAYDIHLNTTKQAGANIIGGSYIGGNYWSDLNSQYAGVDITGDGLGDTDLPYTEDSDWWKYVHETYVPDNWSANVDDKYEMVDEDYDSSAVLNNDEYYSFDYFVPEGYTSLNVSIDNTNWYVKTESGENEYYLPSSAVDDILSAGYISIRFINYSGNDTLCYYCYYDGGWQYLDSETGYGAWYDSEFNWYSEEYGDELPLVLPPAPAIGLNITTDNATGVVDNNATLQGTLNNDTGLPENTLYEHYDAGDNHSESFFGIYWTAQGFTPTTSHTLSMISLKLNKFGNPGILTVGVRLADAFGKPTGADLTNGTIDCSTFSTSYLWKNITLTPYYVSAGTTYVIVIRLAGGDFSNDVGMRMVFGSPTYAGGKWWMSFNSGSTWTFGGTSFDAMFREYNVSYGCITYFEWGTTTAYGNETTHTRNIAVTNVTQNLPGLNIDTTYHYRAVAHSNATNTTAYGVDRSFKTTNHTPIISLIVNVYNESNGSQGIPFNMLIKNKAGSEVFQLLNQTNTLIFNTSNISGNQQIMIQVWSFGYRERVVIIDIGAHFNMNLSFYLPRELMGAGADPGGGTGYNPNSSIIPFIYYIHVVETIRTEYSEFDRAISNANVNVRRFINSTGIFETMSTMKTDTNGFCNLWLIPGVNYLFNITATDFNNELADFIPAPPSNYQTTEGKTFRMTRTGSTGLAFNYTFLMQNITWSILPNTIKNKGAITFVFTITSSDSKLQWFNMQVHYYNNTKKTWVLYFTQNVTTASGGTITYTTPNITGEWKVDVWFKKTGFRSYQLFQTGSLHFTIIYLPSWLDAIPDFVWYLVLIVLMIIIMGFCFVVLGAGLLTGYIGLGVFAFGLLMKPDLTVNGFSGWVIWSITFIIYTMGIFLWSRL